MIDLVINGMMNDISLKVLLAPSLPLPEDLQFSYWSFLDLITPKLYHGFCSNLLWW